MRSAFSKFGASVASCLLALISSANAELATRNVILITLDGVRTQEVFSGMDPLIAEGEANEYTYDIGDVRQRYWREIASERRAALMPFFWGSLVPMGIVLGNAARGSRVTVRNELLFSAPGYAEILTGRPQPDVRSNELRRYEHETVLDYLHRKLQLGKTEIAQLGSWDGFETAASRADDTFFMNGAYDSIPEALSTPEMDLVAMLRKQVMELWEEGSNDALTFRLALAYLKKHKPRVLWLGLSQSDDWAHARRYDRLLDYLHLVDDFLEELWITLQGMDQYRDRTTLIITTDHGRGITLADWSEHGADIPGSENIWIAVIGPDTPDKGEAVDHPPATLSGIAATMLALFGLDYRRYNPHAAPPVPGAIDGQ